MAHTNGIESYRAALKRGLPRRVPQMSPEHLDHYVREFAGRHNLRDCHAVDQMAAVFRGMVGKRRKYDALIDSMPFPARQVGSDAF